LTVISPSYDLPKQTQVKAVTCVTLKKSAQK